MLNFFVCLGALHDTPLWSTTYMSTRMLIIVSLVCGLVILLAFTTQVLIAS